MPTLTRKKSNTMASPRFARLAYYNPHRTTHAHTTHGTATRFKVIMCSLRRHAFKSPLKGRASLLTCYAGSARVIWLRCTSPLIKASCSPFTARPSPLCQLASASRINFIYPCGAVVCARVRTFC